MGGPWWWRKRQGRLPRCLSRREPSIKCSRDLLPANHHCPPLSPSHFYQKFVTPPVLVAGHHHHSSVFEPSFEPNQPVQNFQHPPRHQNSKLAPISRVCLTSKIHNRYLSPTRYFQGFSIKFQHRHRSQIIPRHIGHQRPPRKMIPDVPLHHRLEHAFQ